MVRGLSGGRLDRPTVQAPVRWFDSLPSTQDEAHRLAGEGAPHGTAVAARVQTAGRGTRGRTWASSEGGLWLSVVCRPQPGPSLEVLGVRVGLALAAFLDTLLPAPAFIKVKLPNDLMLGGRKVAGILAEARWQGDRLGWVAVGVGINLHNPVPSGTELPGGRLADAGVVRTAGELAEPVARVVDEAARSAEPLTPAELAACKARGWRGPV